MKTPEQKNTIEAEVKSFANSLPYWGKYLCSEIFAGNEITDDIIDTGYTYLLEELKLKKESEKDEISFHYNISTSADFKENLFFDSLTNVEGVNALVENQTINFTKNLTIIYGANGSGKSGYVRLMKNAFYSKDKRDILPDINKQKHKTVSATFGFWLDDNTFSLKYPDKSENGVFSQFAVFDGGIGKKHLSERNKFSFRPAGLQLFNEFNAALEKLNRKLQDEIEKKNTVNPYLNDDVFQDESEIKTFLTQLSHASELNVLKAHLPYTDEEKKEKERLNEEHDDLQAGLIQKNKTIENLENIKEQLKKRKEALEKLNAYFSHNKLEELKEAIADCKRKEEISQKEGVKSFKTDKIQNIGSTEWKKFIEAAREFALTQNGREEYPEFGDNCLLCQQKINDEATKKLIRSYWLYIKSTAENEAKSALEALNQIKENYEKLKFDLLPETDTLAVWLKKNKEKELIKIKEALQKQEELSREIIESINAKKDITQTKIQLDLIPLNNISEIIDTEIKAYKDDKQDEKINELKKRKTYLEHKEKLNSRYSDIEGLHKNLIWIQKAKQFNKQHFKTQSTYAEKHLSNEYFNAGYIIEFNKECEQLDGKFDIVIDTKSSDAQSNRKLFLKGNDPSAILSEGEQKVIALADFIAECNITKINKGVIFDDPVNSLDEDRKSIIAKRLVSLSTKRQVVIFTHDLVFVYCLVNYAEDEELLHECHWIENKKSKPGQVWLNNSPASEKTYRNARRVKKIYSDAKKDTCSPEEREQLLKNGFAALRTCYEVLVIRDLLQNVVQRFNERVSIDNLSKVYIEEGLKNEILDSFSQCCRYMEGHSHSDKYAYKKPELSNLQEEIDRYEEIKKQIKKASKDGSNKK